MVEANSINLKEVEYDINSVIIDIVNLFSYKIENKKLNFESNIDNFESKLIGDPDKIKRILANLLDNANKKYSPQKRVK